MSACDHNRTGCLSGDREEKKAVQRCFTAASRKGQGFLSEDCSDNGREGKALQKKRTRSMRWGQAVRSVIAADESPPETKLQARKRAIGGKREKPGKKKIL